MKLLVIGGSSFIGAYTVDELLNRGHEVVATGRNPSFKFHYDRLGVSYVKVDMVEAESLAVLDAWKFDAAVSLAARMPANIEKDLEMEDIADYIRTNVVGTINLLDWLRGHGINRLVDIVSRFDCRLYPVGTVIKEETSPMFSYTDDHAAYVVSNNQKAEMLHYYNERYGMKNIWLRIPSIYGVGPHGSFAKDGVVIKSGLQIFMEKAAMGEEIVVYGDPDTPKDVLYVKDMARAIADALESNDGKGLYNVSYDENFSILELAQATAKAFAGERGESTVSSDPSVPNNGSFPRMDNTKIKKELGFKPLYGDPYVLMEDYHRELERGEYAKLFT
ncbi:MAG: NAD(P)-dependent oxidoreductase [Coriobacteriaceae bacterium]|nr:NAD(P)-dependent oxidoreductase [Coriobacteriaceae bacterium]